MSKAGFIVCLLNIAWKASAQVPEWQNPEIVQVNRVPMRATSFPFVSETEAAAGMEKASNFESLNGLWKFRWCAKPEDVPYSFEQILHEDYEWDNFQVPSNWEFKNYGKPGSQKVTDKPVGLYRRSFVNPANWKDKQVFIHFEGVRSAFYLWCNGRYVGYSEDSKLPAEFDLTSYILKEKNHLTVKVMGKGDAAEIENQDYWKICGIERDVYLFATEKARIQDFAVRSGLTDHEKNGNLEIDYRLRSDLYSGTQVEVGVVLKDPDGKIIYQKQEAVSAHPNQVTEHLKAFGLKINHIKAWNAEEPNLYELTLILKNDKGIPIQVLKQSVGFRNTELKDGQLFLNGTAIQLRGAVRFETDPEDGHVVSESTILKDIRRMKELNMNAVLLPYPQAPLWYELCNRYGLYVVESPNFGKGAYSTANIEEKKWRTVLLDRAQRTIDRDKNQPSIIAWNPGLADAPNRFEAVKEIMGYHDKTRPVILKPEGFSLHWAEPWMHAYRNGEPFFAGRNHWNQEALSDDSTQKYGVNPDRNDKPGTASIAETFSTIGLHITNTTGKVKILVKNQFSFRTTEGMAGKIKWFENGQQKAEMPFSVKAISPGDSQTVVISIPKSTSPSGRSCLVEILTVKPSGLLPSGHVFISKKSEL